MEEIRVRLNSSSMTVQLCDVTLRKTQNVDDGDAPCGLTPSP